MKIEVVNLNAKGKKENKMERMSKEDIYNFLETNDSYSLNLNGIVGLIDMLLDAHGVPPRIEKWEPEKPAWAWVHDLNPHPSVDDGGKFIVIFKDGHYQSMTNDGEFSIPWNFATPCKDDEIPQWWKDSEN